MDYIQIGSYIFFGAVFIVWWIIKYDDYHDD